MLAHENIQVRSVDDHISVASAVTVLVKKFSCSHSGDQASQRAWENQRQSKEQWIFLRIITSKTKQPVRNQNLDPVCSLLPRIVISDDNG